MGSTLFCYAFKLGLMGAAVAAVVGLVLTAVISVWYLCHLIIAEKKSETCFFANLGFFRIVFLPHVFFFHNFIMRTRIDKKFFNLYFVHGFLKRYFDFYFSQLCAFGGLGQSIQFVVLYCGLHQRTAFLITV